MPRRTRASARRAAMSCPGSWRAAGDGGPGLRTPSGASTTSERPSRSRFRGTAKSGLICHRRLVEDWRAEHRANRAYEAYRARGVMKDGRRFGRPPGPYEPPEPPAGKINTIDPDARRMKFGRNFIPAYNARPPRPHSVSSTDTIASRALRKPGRLVLLTPLATCVWSIWSTLARPCE
jgi:hypothetical protein